MANSAVSFEYLDQQLNNINNQLTIINNQLVDILWSITVSELTVVPALRPELSGLSTSIISIGPQFNFFGTGALDHQQSLSNGAKYYLLTQNVAGQPQQFPELDYYLGSPAVTTMWVSSGSNAYNFPVYFDSTGIFFIPTSTTSNLQTGSTFSFTMLLILAPEHPHPPAPEPEV